MSVSTLGKQAIDPAYERLYQSWKNETTTPHKRCTHPSSDIYTRFSTLVVHAHHVVKYVCLSSPDSHSLLAQIVCEMRCSISFLHLVLTCLEQCEHSRAVSPACPLPSPVRANEHHLVGSNFLFTTETTTWSRVRMSQMYRIVSYYAYHR